MSLSFLILDQNLIFFSANPYICVGHGGSDGLHAYVHSLDDAVSDMVCSRTYKYFVGYCLNKF